MQGGHDHQAPGVRSPDATGNLVSSISSSRTPTTEECEQWWT